MSRRINLQFLALAFGLLVLASSAHAQTYTFHQQFLGIYFTPELARNGFSVDIQNGDLFGVVYSYAGAGDDAFLTLFAPRPAESDQFRFSGDVFLTNNAGNTTIDEGDFTIEMVTVFGQPGLVLSMDSPYVKTTDELLFRFGYGDGDQLGPIAGKLWGISFTTSTGTISVLDFIGGFFLIGDERLELDGDTGLAVTTGRQDTLGVAFYDADSREFIIGLDVSGGRDTLIFEAISSHSDMFGGVSQFRDGAEVDSRAFVGTNAVTVLTRQGKRAESDWRPSAADLRRFRELARQAPPPVPMPRALDLVAD